MQLFDNYLANPQVGTKDIYIYTINEVGGGEHVLLGKRSVNITGRTIELTGKIDFAGGGNRTARVAGWAYDKNDFGYCAYIDVYVDSPAGSGAKGYRIRADQTRSDLGVSGGHGFDSTINIGATGTHILYLYAVKDNANILLGTVSVNLDVNSDPVGHLDLCGADNNGLRVAGWGFDNFDKNCPIFIDVYVGGVAGSGATGYRIRADKSRSDVGNHSFDEYIAVDKQGRQTIYVYAISIDESKHTLIGEWTVDLPYDSVNPVISDVKLINITDTNYTVSCKVTDNLKVKDVIFPTWTHYNDQNDLIWHSGKYIGNDTWVCTINMYDHNNEKGPYTTHIYAYDNVGNSSNYSKISSVVLATTITGVTMDKAETKLTVGENETLSVAIMSEDANNKELIWESSNISVVSVNNGVITALSPGEATITATTKISKKTSSCIVKVLNEVHTVTFDVDSGECLTKSKEVIYSSPYGVLPTPSKIGYIFDG